MSVHGVKMRILENWIRTVITFISAVDSTDYVIIDEYDEIVSYDDFIEMVEWKQEHDKDNPDNFDYSDNVDGYRFTDNEFC